MNKQADTKDLQEAIDVLLHLAEQWQDHLEVEARDKPAQAEGAKMVRRQIARAKRLAGIG